MGLFNRKPKLKNRELIEGLKFRPLKYVTTRNEDGVEYVLGHRGGINLNNDEIIINCEGNEVFRCNMYEAEVGELLSHDGVRIYGKNKEGKMVSVVAYYVYRR